MVKGWVASHPITGSGVVFHLENPQRVQVKNPMKSTTCRLPAVLEEMQVSPEELKGAAQVKTDDFCLRTNDVKYRGQDCSGSLVIHPSLGGRPTGVS